MNFSELAIRRPVTTIMATVALLFVGWLSYSRLNVELFPDVSFPLVVISTTYTGASSQELETLITKPIEDAVTAINGIDHVRSTSGQGNSVVIIEFKMSKDVKQAVQEVHDKVSLIRAKLPEGIDEPVISRVDPDAAPIMNFAIAGNTSVEDLTNLMRDVIKPRLEQVEGVAAVNLAGGQEREVQVTLDPLLLRNYGVSLANVADMLQRENFNLPSGQLQTASGDISLRTTNAYNTATQINQLPVTLAGGHQVLLRDLGTVTDGFKEQRALSWLNGKPALAFSITKQSGANTITVGEGVTKAIEKLTKDLPAGIAITLAYDTTKFIRQSKEASVDELMIGAALAVLVIFAFMRVVRGTIIAAIAIPTSVMGTYIMISAMGYSLNMMTLMALSLVVGVLVDDAVVDLENIFRLMEQGMKPFDAALKATDEIGMAVVAATFSIVAVFLPIGFMNGIIGRFFAPFGLTVSCAVLISLIVARTLTPTLAAYILKPIPPKEHVDPWYARAYVPILRWSLTHRKSVIALAIGFFVISLPIAGLLGKGFVPKNDRDEFQITVKMPPTTSMAVTSATVQEIARRVQAHPMIKTVLASAGSAASGQVDTGLVGVTAKSRKEGRKQDIYAIQATIQQSLKGIPAAKITISETRAVDTGAGSYPINLKLQGNDLDELNVWGNKLQALMKTIPGVIDTDSKAAAGQREFHAELDQQKAAEVGIGANSLARALRLASQGETPTKLRLPDRDVDVRVRLNDAARYDLRTLENLTLTGTNGNLVPLSSVAKLTYTSGPTTIERYDRRRQITINGATIPGMSANKAVEPLDAAIQKLNLPRTLAYKFDGEAEQMKDAFGNLIMALVMAIVFIYLILASQFEHFLHPFTIMMSLPLSFSGAFFALFIGNEDLSMMSMIGIVMLMGLVTKNAILLVDYTIVLRKEGVARADALLKAGPVRLRPILMTSVAMIAGMMPVALRLTVGSEGRAPMAVTVIGGLITSTLLTLVVVPVVYTLVDDAIIWAGRKLGGDKASAQPLTPAGEPHV